MHDDEEEVLLPPGSRFIVRQVRVSAADPNETRIVLEELPPYEAIMEYGDFIPEIYRAIEVRERTYINAYIFTTKNTHMYMSLSFPSLTLCVLDCYGGY
jgi:hypothetical protein